jgi:hypothetical protein
VAQYVSAAAAIVVAAYPYVGHLRLPGIGYSRAIAALSEVRLRLIKTSRLGDDQKKAIDVLTLALVDGSDQ